MAENSLDHLALAISLAVRPYVVTSDLYVAPL